MKYGSSPLAINSIEVCSTTVGVGSCVKAFDDDEKPHLMIVCGLFVVSGGLMEMIGWELEQTNSGCYSVQKVSSFFLSSISSDLFLPLWVSNKPNRSFWPPGVVFVEDVDGIGTEADSVVRSYLKKYGTTKLTIGAALYRIRHEYPYELHSFLSNFLSSLKKLFKNNNIRISESQLSIQNPSPTLLNFLAPEGNNSQRWEYEITNNFSPLDQILGAYSFFTNTQEDSEPEVCRSGWGFWEESGGGTQFITTVTISLNKNQLLKVKARRVVAAASGRWLLNSNFIK